MVVDNMVLAHSNVVLVGSMDRSSCHCSKNS